MIGEWFEDPVLWNTQSTKEWTIESMQQLEWMISEALCWVNKSQPQKIICHMILFTKHFHQDKTVEMENRFMVAVWAVGMEGVSDA